jgi:hypothetical protein
MVHQLELYYLILQTKQLSQFAMWEQQQLVDEDDGQKEGSFDRLIGSILWR